MEQKTETGKLVIKRFFDYYVRECLDDKTEFFPVLKTIILGFTDSFKNTSQKAELEKQLKEYAKQLYISLWLSQVEEEMEEYDDDEEEEYDIEDERKEANGTFERFYSLK